MSVHEFKRFDLTCDNPKCDQCWEGMDEVSEKTIKNDARLEGWFIEDDNCLCPLHAPKKRRKK